MPKLAKKESEEINIKNEQRTDKKTQVKEIVDLMASALETADRKIEEIKNICLHKDQ